MVKVLFVCTGNICRSPTAEGVFRAAVATSGFADRIEVDSAGTHSYHVGEPPDSRSTHAARARNVDISDQRARKIRGDDFASFDLILAMDRGHLKLLRRAAPSNMTARLEMFLDFAPGLGIRDVPDPYYGAGDGFEEVLDLVEAATDGLLAHIREKLL